MSREWKPGDLGVTAKGRLALRRENNPDGWIDSQGAPWSTDRFPGNVRPLVVIDPEDREQVERLMAIYMQRPRSMSPLGTSDTSADMQAALREYANPTPPTRWTDGDVIQSVATDLVWVRDYGTWQPANGESRVPDEKVDGWAALGSEQCRVLREQAAEVRP